MISLDQVLLLQKKVETAVEKIAFLKGQIEQLKSENDALHTQCAELTKALDEKTELVSSLESNQGKIEEGILSALNRLDTVENSILNNSDNSEPSSEDTPSEQVSFDQQAELEPVAEETSGSEEQNNNEQSELGSTENAEQPQQEPFRYEIVPDEPSEEESESDNNNTAESLNGQFDIF